MVFRKTEIKPKRVMFLTGLVLFFCLFANLGFAATPTLGSISPSSGSLAPLTAVTFTTTYSDTSGWAHLKECYLLVSTGPTVLANSAYLYYDQNSNLLYIRNDANTTWLGGFAPGSSNVIENSYVKLNCATTTATGSVNTLTIKWNVTFKQAYSGKAYNTYLSAKDDLAKSVSLSKKGTYTINTAPTLGTITPASGTGQIGVQQIFTTTYTDPDGWANIQYVYLLINSSTAGNSCFYGYYNQNTNQLYLRDNINSAWLGGYTPGSSYVIENSYAKLDCSQTTVIGNGSTLTINWAVNLKQPFTGAKNTYLYVKDDVNIQVALTKKGTWTLPNNLPALGTLTPSDITTVPNQPYIFTSTFSDADTWDNIQQAYLIINTSATGVNGFYGYYNQDNGKLYLRNDANSAWVGGYAAGSSNIIENSFVKLDCASSVVSGSGNDLTVKWSITFKSTFSGSKKTYLYMKDYAGSSKGWTQKGTLTAFDSGKIIGPEGGEVVSPDGKVKAVIPAGALSTATPISIASVTKEAMTGAVPSGTAFLSAVECKPYGLVFNKPISLIYKLDQAEIPGTPVELGLYDSVQKKILPTGQVSIVPADGYTITCSVSHFSTYAALKSLTPQTIPIGGGVKIPLPDMFTGAFGHGIPITVPPGRKGLQPAVGLSYRSSNSNSWVGLGFSLNSGYIVRSTRLGPPSYIDTQDTFYFITDAGTTELVHLIDNLYQAKVESSFTKFFKDSDDSWRAVGKDGSVLRFGQNADAKEISTQGTFSWYLTRAIDNNSNYIEYHYTKDQGKSYLSRIDYTGNEALGVSPTNSVDFYLEARTDKFSSYISSSKISTEKRLKEIQVKVNGSLVWRYLLEYAYSVDTDRSLLKSVTQYAGDGKNLPVQKFNYQNAK